MENNLKENTETQRAVLNTKKLNWNMDATRMQNAKLWEVSSFENSKG